MNKHNVVILGKFKLIFVIVLFKLKDGVFTIYIEEWSVPHPSVLYSCCYW